MDFKLTSKYQPTGDQPEAIRELTAGVERGDHAQLCGFGEEGDVNHDGNVNLADAQTVLGIMARDDYEKGADVNNDGFVNLADYQTILGIMARQ